MERYEDGLFYGLSPPSLEASLDLEFYLILVWPHQVNDQVNDIVSISYRN